MVGAAHRGHHGGTGTLPAHAQPLARLRGAALAHGPEPAQHPPAAWGDTGKGDLQGTWGHWGLLGHRSHGDTQEDKDMQGHCDTWGHGDTEAQGQP